MSDRFEVVVDRIEGDRVHVRATGDLGAGALAPVDHTLHRLVSCGCTEILVDLAEVQSLAPCVHDLMTDAAGDFRARGALVRVCEAPPPGALDGHRAGPVRRSA